MNLDLVIQQLRSCCPALGGRVGGVADFDGGDKGIVIFNDPTTSRYVFPSAVVAPGGYEGEPNSMLGDSLFQTVNDKVAIIVQFDASPDRRGQAASDQIEGMLYALHGALLNWHIDPARSPQGLSFESAHPLQAVNRALLFWEFVYALPTAISDADGFQPSGDPLTSAQADMPIAGGSPGGAPDVVAELLQNPVPS